MRRALQRVANVNDPKSLSNRLRRRRLDALRERLSRLPGRVRVLDVGGTERFWTLTNLVDAEDIDVTVVNLTAPPTSHPAVTAVVGDATSLPQFRDSEFDVAFSNSVIEHVGDLDAQRRMASEVRRVARRYYVQTPCRWFPIEPHFLFPFFGVLPEEIRIWLVRHFRLGWRPRCPDPEVARAQVRSVRLLRRSELQAMFPDGEIRAERFLGLTKSYVVFGGW